MLILWILPLQAQVFHFPVARLFPAPGPEKYYLDKKEHPSSDDGPGIQYNLLLQSGYFGIPGYGNGFSYSVSPSFSYTVSPRFMVTGGIAYTSYMLPQPDENSRENSLMSGNMKRNVIVYAQGTYMVRPNFFLTGSIVKNLNRNRSPFFQNPYSVQSGDSYSLRMDYFLTKSIRFGAEFRYSNNYYPGFGFPHGYDPYLPWY